MLYIPSQDICSSQCSYTAIGYPFSQYYPLLQRGLCLHPTKYHKCHMQRGVNSEFRFLTTYDSLFLFTSCNIWQYGVKMKKYKCKVCRKTFFGGEGIWTRTCCPNCGSTDLKELVVEG